MTPRIVIVGGGISGLAAAFRISQRLPYAQITVLESHSKPGGQIGTTKRDGFVVERGPNGLFDAKPFGVRLAKDVGLGEKLIAGSESSRKNRFLFVDQLHKLPGSPLGILRTPLLSWKGRLSLLLEPFRRKKIPKHDESIAEFAQRRFGMEAANTFVDGLVTGIYAGDPKELSLASCFPRLAKYEQDAGSVLRGVLRMRKQKREEAQAKNETPAGPQQLWSLRGGLSELIDALASRVNLVVGVQVTKLTRSQNGQRNTWTVQGEGKETWIADALILTCPAYQQGALLQDHHLTLATELSEIEYNRIAVVALGYRQTDVIGPQDGFGYISPQNRKRPVLGVQWCTSVFPDRAPKGYVLWRALCGGVQRRDVADLPDQQLLKTVHQEMQTIIGVKGEPIFHEIIRWPRAIPQYRVGHAERLQRIDHAVGQLPGLMLAGNAFRGVALADCAENAELIAEKVEAYLAK